MELLGADALNENDVVEHVCRYLEGAGYSIEKRCTTRQTGDDIIARRSDGVRLYIEAKGATSALSSSKRFGQAFDQSQASVHVAEAAFRALKTLSRDAGAGTERAGIALPANALHRRLMNPALPAILELGVVVLWVEGDGSVSVSSSWRVTA